jgi:hypothetical protein
MSDTDEKTTKTLEERKVEALERIAATLERLTTSEGELAVYVCNETSEWDNRR